MSPKKDEYMRGYGDGFKDGLAEAKRVERQLPEPKQPDTVREGDN